MKLKHPDIYESPDGMPRYKGCYGYICVDSLSRCQRCEQPAVWNAVAKDSDEWEMICEQHYQAHCYKQPSQYPSRRLIPRSEFVWVDE